MCIYSTSMIIPAYSDFSKEFGVSLQKASFLTSVQILFLGFSPLVWTPLSARYGRHPLYLFSALSTAGCAFAGAFCHSYGTLMTVEVFTGICLSPALALGAATVQEMFFQRELGQKASSDLTCRHDFVDIYLQLGIWTVLLTLPASPLIGGFIVQNKGPRWLFFVLAILQLSLFFGYLFFGFETLYIRPMRVPGQRQVPEDDQLGCSYGSKLPGWLSELRFRRIDPRPLHPSEFFGPLLMVFRPPIILCTLGYSFIFSYAGIIIGVLIPQFLQTKFRLNNAQAGLQFVGPIIGGVISEQIGGRGSDWLMSYRTRRAGGRREPEMRLAASYPGFLLGAIGVIVWGVQLQNATPGKWNVTPVIGSSIAWAGLQLASTPVYAYCLEAYPLEAAQVSAFIVVFRQVYGFTVPFYAANGAVNLGLAKMTGIFGALTGAGAIPVIACELWGKKWRQRRWPGQ
ncbi:MFS general substrate transporter [Punctularia strigosozonata HHB-11173 SS5]|uniref:MFS general substrate transporter n=1 Tax=Punctularia strigosozonata (strain HHB-11173) TaxID=741275 RepID=R7S4S1_PUNST|nr:MFS general substrate transporter [Punctularia strigosozonata HHB-11173 SS5]EIN04884.1 MFS general substrate transporter [Punctularia strigosozonata HHB-11173 SS5]